MTHRCVTAADIGTHGYVLAMLTFDWMLTLMLTLTTIMLTLLTFDVDPRVIVTFVDIVLDMGHFIVVYDAITAAECLCQ